ncbi:MAG: NAD(P)/FAD-dependent oxidoreductase [Betaproteobacteria bacterium]|nr:NAD(P)/FAD-dependent oxidoreductase [Betaproteobacteria bacterium]
MAQTTETALDVVVVGAGFGGIYALYRLRQIGLKVRVFEAGSGVGGTWYWNRYPGARCDVESMQYSYQFSPELEQEWDWTEKYATQPEILRYANHVVDRFDLRRDIQFDTRVTAAHFDEQSNRWQVRTDKGDQVSAKFCLMATGCLSATNVPNINGLDSFKGSVYHTGQWPHEPVDFTGQRVAIIGTGSSAVQSIPIIAQQAKHLYVYQRTPNYAVPARNAPLAPEVKKAIKADYAGLRKRALEMPAGFAFEFNPNSALEATPEERQREYEKRWTAGGLPFMGSFGDLLFNHEANATAAEFVRGKIHELVHDRAVADRLAPKTILGCKRLCVDSGYYETFNRPNVTLIDISGEPIEAITPAGVKVGGNETVVDALILATGFDAMTGTLLRIDIRGKDGLSLNEKWRAGPRTMLGLMTAGFPNLFTITGPGSPSVLAMMILAVEQHVNWVADCVAYMRKRGLARIEPTLDAEDKWVSHVNEVAAPNLRSTCSSWYVGANVPGKPCVFMPYIGGFPLYVRKCDEVVAKGYEGFSVA